MRPVESSFPNALFSEVAARSKRTPGDDTDDHSRRPGDKSLMPGVIGHQPCDRRPMRMPKTLGCP